MVTRKPKVCERCYIVKEIWRKYMKKVVAIGKVRVVNVDTI